MLTWLLLNQIYLEVSHLMIFHIKDVPLTTEQTSLIKQSFCSLNGSNILELIQARSVLGHINFSPQSRARRCDNLIPEPRNVYVDNGGLIKEPNERFYEICTHRRTFVINNDPQRSGSYGEKYVLTWIFPFPFSRPLNIQIFRQSSG